MKNNEYKSPIRSIRINEPLWTAFIVKFGNPSKKIRQLMNDALKG